MTVFSAIILWPLIEEIGKWIYSRFFTGWRIMYPYVIYGLFEYYLYVFGDGVSPIDRIIPLTVHLLTGLIMWRAVNKKVALMLNLTLHVVYNTIIISLY